MKSKFYRSVIILFLFITVAWEIPDINLQRENSYPIEKISGIDLRKIPTEVYDLNLSELVSDLEIIPLETKAECPIGNTWVDLSKDNILVGTQNFPGPAKLYRFDKSGKFLNEIGKPGRGPGEHTGYSADVIHFDQDKGVILVRWTGGTDNPQVFKPDGTFLFEITQPYKVENIDKWTDSIWFSTGKFSGPAVMPRDSFALIFYNRDGKISGLIRRNTYPPTNLTGYTPSPMNPSLYKFNGTWKLYMEGNDTIFKIIGKKLIPSGILLKDKNALPFNMIISSDNIIGKYSLRILAETEGNIIIEKNIITKAELKEIRPGRWSGGFSTDDQLIIFDKKSNKAKLFRIKDDVYNLFPDEAFPSALNWQNSNLISISLQAIPLLKILKDKQELIKQKPMGQKLIKQLKDLKEDSNPVIFTFNFDKKITIE